MSGRSEAVIALHGPPRRSSASAAVARIGRRLSRVSMLLWELARTRPRAGRSLEERTRMLSWLAENLCALHGLEVDVVGRLPTPPVVLCANHLGYFDPMVLLALHGALPIAKRELAAWPLVGECLGSLGVEFVDRGDAHRGAIAIRRGLAALEAGTSVLVFPEGTTSVGEEILPLRRGMIGAARIADVPIVPVVLAYENEAPCWIGDDWFVPHYAGMLAQRSIAVRVAFGAPMRATDDGFAGAERVRREMTELLGRVRFRRQPATLR
jgi:lyso-ornithine lipid O-acyltransferase